VPVRDIAAVKSREILTRVKYRGSRQELEKSLTMMDEDFKNTGGALLAKDYRTITEIADR